MKQDAEIGEKEKQFSIPFCDLLCSQLFILEMEKGLQKYTVFIVFSIRFLKENFQAFCLAFLKKLLKLNCS